MSETFTDASDVVRLAFQNKDSSSFSDLAIQKRHGACSA